MILYIKIASVLNKLIKFASEMEMNLVSVERCVEYSSLENEVREPINIFLFILKLYFFILKASLHKQEKQTS